MGFLTSLFPLCSLSTKISDRLAAHLALILTNVALQMSLRNSAALPKVSYSTMLDDFMYTCFTLLLLVCFCSVMNRLLVAHIPEGVMDDDLGTLDLEDDAYKRLRIIDSMLGS